VPDSLLIANAVELLGGGQVLQDGPAAGAMMKLYQGYKMGAPVIDNDAVASLLIDGEWPYGERVSNRTMEIPVLIRAPGRMKLMQAREVLLDLVTQQAWTLTYQPDGLPPIVWDCFRASYDMDQTGLREEKQDYAIVNLTFQASPYGRSTDPQVIQLTQDAARVVDPILVDSFDTAPGSGWATASVPRLQGTKSSYTLGKNTAIRTFAAKDLSGMASIQVSVTMAGTGVPFDGYLNLYDSAGKIYNVGRAHAHLRGNDVWDRLSWTLTPPGDFDITKVFGYQLAVTSGCYLDQMVAVPPSSSTQATARGAVMQVPGVLGTARAPMNLALSLESGAVFGQMLVHRPPSDADLAFTPLVPLSITQVPDGTLQAFPIVNDAQYGFRFNGTYTICVNFSTWGASSTRTLTVYLRQWYNDFGTTGATYSDKTITATVDKTTGRLQVVSQVSLPLISGAKDNGATSWAVGITSTDTTDRISEIMFLDTRGETLIMHSLRGIAGMWVDEPDTINDPYDLIGKVIGGTSRTTALSLSSTSSLPYRPLSLEPGDNQLLLFSPDGAPQGTATVNPRWRTVRLS
jgi:hypothetical protein